ncbi:MAG: hypothetical protein WCC80_14780, partial [Pseudolabrys sp.]
ERMRRIGVLAGLAENDPEMQADLAAFREGLHKLGWTEAAMSKSIIAGPPEMKSVLAKMWLRSSPLRLMSF